MKHTKELPYDETIQCVQCGYCLPACPTYVTMERETHSPRGRINLVKMAAEGHLSLHELEGPLDLCLGCRACETACPSGVEYGKILEGAREVLAEHKARRTSKPLRKMQDAMFRNVFPDSKKLKVAADMIWLYQKSGLQKVAHKGKLTRVLPQNLWAFEEVLPQVTSPAARRHRPRLFEPPQGTRPKWKVAFFYRLYYGCDVREDQPAVYGAVGAGRLRGAGDRRADLLRGASRACRTQGRYGDAGQAEY